MTQLDMADPVDTTGEQALGPVLGRTAGVMTRSIRAYQLARTGRPTGCRYIPSCSEYAIEAIGLHGAVRGGALAARRLTRCTPWGGHGVDPVPDRRTPCTHP
jgi:uncharacterized protein